MEWTKFLCDLLLGVSPLFLMLFILCKIHYDNKWGIDDWTFWYGSREEIKALKEKKRNEWKKEKKRNEWKGE